MSFSSTVKNDLCRLKIAEGCCSLAELAAIIRINGTMKGKHEESITLVTENAAISRRVFSQIKFNFDISPQIKIRRNTKLKKHILYLIIIPEYKGINKLFSLLNIKYDTYKNEWISEDLFFNGNNKGKTCCKRSYLRGAFLTGGSISDPDKTYHLELSTHSIELANELRDLLNDFDLNAKVINRKGNFITYLKEGQDIVDFLNIIGAHKALMELENIRILKEMRNNVNRIVNCETANLEKTVNASVRQAENIKYLIETIGFEKIPKNLREIAELRLEYQDANLQELGKMLKAPLSKSGVNHRLKKLDNMAEEIRNLRNFK